MLSVSLIRCTNEALKKLHLKSTIKWFKEVKIDKWPDLSYSFLPIASIWTSSYNTDIKVQRLFKEEIRSILNVKRKRKIFPSKNYENWIRNKEVRILKFHFFSENTSWPVLMNIQRANWWCHPLTIFYWFHIQIWQKSLRYENIKLA